MKEKEDIFRKLEKNKQELDRFGVTDIGVFGSYARGQEDEESDIDFLVVFEEGEKTYRNYRDLKDFLDQLFNQDIDLATEQSLKPSIRENVVGEVEYVETA